MFGRRQKEPKPVADSACRICGARRLKIVQVDSSYRVECRSCNAQSLLYPSKEELIADYQRRLNQA